MLVFGFFWSASLPQFEAITLNHLGERVATYTHVRIWGSIGFIIAVTLVGSALVRRPVSLVPVVVLVLLAATWALSLATPERAAPQAAAPRAPFRAVLFRPEVLTLFAVCFLLQLAYGPYYNFYSVFLANKGYSASVIGRLWALGVLAEVAVFIVMHRLLLRYSLRALMLASGVAAVIRWPLIAFGVGSLPLLIGAQLLHALTFGVQHAVAMQLIHRYFRGHHQGRGQALYSSLAYGLGGACGAVASGYSWEWAGATWTFVAAAACSALAVLIAWRWLERDRV
jgi:PPP family 3-phenylpropionic acid transporter